MAIAQAGHLVLGGLVVQLADLAVGIEFGFTERDQQLAQCRLCLGTLQQLGILLLQRQQPALLLPRSLRLVRGADEQEQQGKGDDSGGHDQQQGEWRDRGGEPDSLQQQQGHADHGADQQQVPLELIQHRVILDDVCDG
ncbi:hypothetical protein D3C78_1186930 [compost metagenome]